MLSIVIYTYAVLCSRSTVGATSITSVNGGKVVGFFYCNEFFASLGVIGIGTASKKMRHNE